ncbi:hypothetical protein CDB79_RS18785 [Vibrio parahaemolyticus]|uniref:hypothetical protein n=1 Tax=Vibrio parahaemolyticus TaxID=670 RepID=UPI000DF9C4FD|nr:hypothetical protein [Vibrio parahaemolyticus]EJG1710629.1 hypothetical protein [Vibrio parahaemolyticus]EJG1744006.1 hypothetical protein [Vibrio parahaemolyticus]EJG1781719.1 hypothetical protein [Vibrio parahaemolyticus]SUP22780.1 Uncharacterised protein [Vibrio parahaemolyticus]
MNKVAINTSELSTDEIILFIKTFAQIFSSGQGSKTLLSKSLSLGESDGIKALLGVSEEWLTNERRTVIEGVYAFCFKHPLPLTTNIWQKPEPWKIKNPNSIDHTHDMNKCLLDFGYLESFGIRMSIIEKEILLIDSKAYLSKVDSNAQLEQSNLRLFTALALFGFNNPYEFFIPR